MQTFIRGAAMAKDVSADGPRKKKAHAWGDRKEDYATISVMRDVARMAARVAKDEGLNVAELTEPLLRGPLEKKLRAILERELKGLSGPG